MKLLKYVFYIILISTITYGQVKIVNSEISSNILTYEIEVSKNYSIKVIDRKKRIVFQNFLDESRPQEAAIPSNDIFIAIPPLTTPNVSYNILKQNIIDALPKLNPEVKLEKEEVVYKEALTAKYSENNFLKVLGYLWIGNNYCIHIKLSPYLLDGGIRIINIEKFQLKISFSNQIHKKEKTISTNVDPIILNQGFAAKVQSNPQYNIEKSDSWIDYNKTYLKLGIARDGIYRLYKTDLEAQNINVQAINPKTFKMILKGKEIPIWVEGENDLSFDQNDFIEFAGIRNMGGHHREVSNYGEPYNEYLGRYTDTTVYWLTWDGIDGKRVEVSDGNAVSAIDTLEYYSQIEHYEKNNWFDFSCASLVRRELPYWIENKTWHEGNLYVGTRTKNFSVSDVFPDKQAELFVKLQDYASNISSNAHLLSLGLNNHNPISDSIYVNKYEQVVLETDINSSSLQSGINELKINSLPTDATVNSCIFDWYEVEYPRYLKPFNDSLNFSFPFIATETERWIKLQDVNTNNYSIWKYGDTFKKYNISKINNEIIFADTINGNNKFTFIDESKIHTPKIYYAKKFRDLRSPQLKADYIAITHPKFSSKAQEYVQFISDNYNLETKLVLVDDIYDEFAYGFFNPEAIKDFLKATHTYWGNPKPQYVFLIGGATYDYYGNKYHNFSAVKERVLNYVPSFGASVSDNWFVTWDTTGAYIPQMNIGRIPVTTNEELDWYFTKHRNYLTQDYDDWNKRYLFFSGGDEHKQSEIDLLRETNQYVIDTYTKPAPIGGNTEHFYKTINPPSNFGPYTPNYIKNSIDNGGVFISYLGHSGTQTWDNSITDPAQLKNNRDRYPIVTDFGCSTGRFAEPDVVSFSKLFTLSSDGQALSYIGNASLGFISTTITMPKLFYKNILSKGIFKVSEAHKQAKIEMLETYGSTGVYELFALTNTLIGDPLITLPIPPKPNFIIKERDIRIHSDIITDLQDSINMSFLIFNYGTVLKDSLEILVTHSYQTNIDSTLLKTKIPNYRDSLNIKLAVKNMAGDHQVSIILDPQNSFEELSKKDNISTTSFYVASSSLRPIVQYQVKNGFDKGVNFLNPTSSPSGENIVVEYSVNKDFSEVNNIEVHLDTLYTPVSFTQLQKDQRYWCRAKLEGANTYSTIFSFNNLNNNKFSLTDSISFDDNFLTDLRIENDQIFIDSTHIKFEIFSAGFSDGNTALILKNDKNYLYNGTLRGHYVTLFKDLTYEFVESKVFDLLEGGSTVVEEYSTFLDTVSSNYLVIFAIKDEGSINLSTSLRDKIKLFGSALIDDLGFRGSWAFIGKKGASVGTMPEAVSAEGDGPVTIDTTISFLSDSGTMLTTEIGPTSKWDKLVVNQETPSFSSSIVYKPIGVRDDGILDTLQNLSFQDSVADLSFIDATLYPKIKLLAEFNASNDKQSPILNSLGVDYTDAAELGLNYQVVSVEHDSVTQGEKNKLSFYIYNVGESKADSFSVKVELLKPDNSTQPIDKFVTTIDSMSRKYFEYNYTLLKEYGWGNMYFAITADTENKITEFFEDNNYYQIPFYVKKDTLTDIVTAEATVTIDGYDIIDGDFVANQPEIIFQIDYDGPFPVYDTTAVNYYLDNKRIPYSEMQVDYDTINQTIKSTYIPQLGNGDHFLKVSGNMFSLNKYFTVSNELKIINLYNYPNPFGDKTSFTFKLTRIPEEIAIKIYTVAGRLIKNISLTSNDLKTDFNKIEWDGRDEDGDQIANGVYIYKVILKDAGESSSYVQKLAVMR